MSSVNPKHRRRSSSSQCGTLFITPDLSDPAA